jgi:hypothetical protein
MSGDAKHIDSNKESYTLSYETKLSIRTESNETEDSSDDTSDGTISGLSRMCRGMITSSVSSMDGVCSLNSIPQKHTKHVQ